MKHIVKMGQPHELRQWFENQPIEDGHRINCSYGDMPGEVKQIVKQQLIREQGGLCCYTGIRINYQASHIEHFKSQRQCKEETTNEDVDYTNMLAAFPGDRTPCSFGARVKGDWYDTQLLISPLRQDCETRFRFDLLGQITSAQKDDQAAQETIKNLSLDHGSLTEMRKQAIDTALFRQNQSLSEAQLRRVSEGYSQRNSSQLFKPFCFVIIQAAQELLRKVERRRKSKQFSRQQRRK